jgi:hypothetical protein
MIFKLNKDMSITKVGYFKPIIFVLFIIFITFGVTTYLTPTITDVVDRKIEVPVPIEYYDTIRYKKFLDRIGVENKLAFIYAVKSLSYKVNIPYEDLLIVMSFESGIKPTSKNPLSGAYGLFQLTPTTAEGLGISREKLYKSDEYKQLDYFEKYLKYHGLEKIKTFGDLYMIIYLPSWVNKPNKQIPENILRANPAYKNLKTVGDFKLYVQNKYNKIKRKEF